MPMIKDNDAAGSLSLGMTYADAKAMILENGFMFEYLPKVFQTKELRDLSNQWWEDRFLNLYEYYKGHPSEVMAILSQAKVAGGAIEIDASMKFDVELAEIE